jgi:hypothetical protein
VKRDLLWRISVVLSALVLLTTALLWMRSLWARDRIAFNVAHRRVWVESFPHHLYITYGKLPPALVDEVLVTLQLHNDQIQSRPRYWEVRWQRLRGGFTGIGIPYWLTVLLTSALPIRWIGLRVVKSQRHRHGLCAACGYDLRASTDRCPECGEPITKPAIP